MAETCKHILKAQRFLTTKQKGLNQCPEVYP